MGDLRRGSKLPLEPNPEDKNQFPTFGDWLRRRRSLRSPYPPAAPEPLAVPAVVEPPATVTEPAPPEPSPEATVPVAPGHSTVTLALPLPDWDWAPVDDSRPIAADLRARFVLVAATVGYIWLFSYWTMRHHDGFGTSAFDFGLYDQGVWLLSRFERPFVTIMGRHLFGDHTSFILLPLVPVYWVIPSAKVLLFSQAAALGSAAVPTFLLAREKLRDEWLAALLAAAYLLHPVVGLTNLEQFHPDVFEVPLALFALYFMGRHRWVAFGACVLGLLLVKEDVALLTLPLGIYVAVRHNRRVGVATCVASVVAMASALWWILPMYNGVGSLNAWRLPFGGLKGLIRTSFVHPGKVVEYLGQDERPWYVWQLFIPFAWLPVLAPRVLLIGLAPLASNVVSNFYYQHRIGFHYSTLVLPVLVAATIYGVARFRSFAGRRIAIGLIVATSLACAYLWGPTPLGRHEAVIASPSGPSVPHLKRAIAMIPDDAVVSSFYGYVPHVDHRKEIYMFPNPFKASYWGTFKQEGQRLPQADRVEYILVPTALDPEPAAVLAQIRADFEVVYEAGNVTLMKQKAAAPAT